MEELSTEKFEEALNSPQPLLAMELFCAEHKLAVTPAEILAIAKMICSAAETVCPLINNL